ncbi:hypothetical protein [Streptomyces griseorubiginosus]|uniref:hypothetical protein n=1 Tax=Streptomyces griseorubiginosus TaxID=67304 RepID=UPI00364CAE48
MGVCCADHEHGPHPGPAALLGSLWLDDHRYRHRNPWITAGGRPEYEGIDGAVTGYVTGGEDPGDGVHLAEKHQRHEHMIDRLVRGLPVIRGGHAVAPLEELPPVK